MSDGVNRIKKIFKQIHKFTFKKFICHVEDVKGSIDIYE